MLNSRIALAWLLAALAITGGLASNLIGILAEGGIASSVTFDSVVVGLIAPTLYGVLGALIVSRRPENTVGWLLLVTALGAGSPLSNILAAFPSRELNPGLWLVLWVDGWSWIPFIFPVFLIPLFFPDGRLLSPRWKWVIRLALGLGALLAVLIALSEQIGPVDESWLVPNPIGFLPQSIFGDTFMAFWGIGLMTVIAASVASLFIRYRRAGQVQRDQIKWILFAGILFFIGYGSGFLLVEASGETGWDSVSFLFVLLVYPVAIAVAILRHRLYDIDLIIRRTLQYTLVSALLAVVYFGGVVVLQGLFGSITGEGDSPVVTVITTLGIAALFNPLRLRIQDWIDRRFYRAKYDAEQALAQFASTARDEVDVDKFGAALMGLAEETMQPEKLSIWLRPDPGPTGPMKETG